MKLPLLTIGVCVVLAIVGMNIDWATEYVQGCARVFPYGWATEYRVSWDVCQSKGENAKPECGGFSYVVPDESPDHAKPTTKNFSPRPDRYNCVDAFQDDVSVRLCGGTFTFKKQREDVVKQGYRSEWFPITCATTPEQDFHEPDMDAVLVEIRSRCEEVKQETGKSCDCENMPLDCN